MGAKSKYTNSPKKVKPKYLHESNSEGGARIIMTEKVNIPLQIISSSLRRAYFKTEVLYPNERDVVIYQTCPKLTKHLFGESSKAIIVRAFMFDRQSIKCLGTDNPKMHIEISARNKAIEKNFRVNMLKDFIQHPKVKAIFTGLIAIPLSGKQKLLNDLSDKRDRFIEHMKLYPDSSTQGLEMSLSDENDYNVLCFNMPVINIAYAFSALLRPYRRDNPMDLPSPIKTLLKSQFSEKEFTKFNAKVISYEKGKTFNKKSNDKD